MPINLAVQDRNMSAKVKAYKKILNEELSRAPVFSFDTTISDEVVLAFKLADSDLSKEHPVNRIAIYLTSPNQNIPGVFPSGKICHTEILIQVTKGDWRMFSINMLEARKLVGGQLKYDWGKVHMRSPTNLHNYVYVAVHVPRKLQHEMYKFLTSQIDAKFNYGGYCLNHTVACIPIGKRYAKNIRRDIQHRWMCAELIWSALQIGEVKDTENFVACAMSPNSVYEFCRKSTFCAGCTNPMVRLT